MHAAVYVSINPRTKFKVPSFTYSKNMIAESKKLKMGCATLTTPLLRVVCHVSTKFDKTSSSHSRNMTGVRI